MRTSWAVSVALLAAGIAGTVALGDDLNPPLWRGQEGTTFAAWEFLTADDTPAPDLIVNPYGDAEMQVGPGPYGDDYIPAWGGRDGVWPLTGVMKVAIDNLPEAVPDREIWVQVTWASEYVDGHPLVKELLTGTRATLVDQVALEPTREQQPAGQNWVHSTYRILLEPNATFDELRIHGKILVDGVVVETRTAPEPTSLALLLLGGLQLFRRR